MLLNYLCLKRWKRQKKQGRNSFFFSVHHMSKNKNVWENNFAYTIVYLVLLRVLVETPTVFLLKKKTVTNWNKSYCSFTKHTNTVSYLLEKQFVALGFKLKKKR